MFVLSRAHVSQESIISVSSLPRPGHQTDCLALFLHLVMPRCPSCSLQNISARSDAGITILMQFNNNPFCTESLPPKMTNKAGKLGQWRIYLATPPHSISYSCWSMGSVSWSFWISMSLFSVASRHAMIESTYKLMSSESPTVAGALDNTSAVETFFPATWDMV